MKQWHGVESLGEAYERTKRLLFPVRWGLWLRLALVVMLIGSGGGGGNGGSGGSSNSSSPSGSGSSGSYSSAVAPAHLQSGAFGGSPNPLAELGSNIALLVAVIAVVAMVVLVLVYLSSISTFVFVKALLSGDLKLIGYYSSQAENGLKLFLFQLAVTVLLIAFAVAAVLAGYYAWGALDSTLAKIALVAVAAAAFIAVIAAAAVFMWTLTELVVPIMYASGCGLFAGMGRLKGLVGADPWQFAVFIVLRIGLGFCGWVVRAMVSLAFYLPLIAILIVGGAGASLLGASEAALTVGLVALIPVILAIEYVTSLITLPVSVFLRYCSLVFLQRVEPSLDLFNGEKDVSAGKPKDKETHAKVKVY